MRTSLRWPEETQRLLGPQFATLPTAPRSCPPSHSALLVAAPSRAPAGIRDGDPPSGTWQRYSAREAARPGPRSQPFLPSQLQRLKRSLSLKTILRSKSVENFFLRSGSELKCPTEVLLTPPTPLPPPSPPLASTDRGLPTPAPSPCPGPRPLASLKPVRLHSFQEHVFKRASPCELCHQLIVGRCLERAGRGRGGGPRACLRAGSRYSGPPVLTEPRTLGGQMSALAGRQGGC